VTLFETIYKEYRCSRNAPLSCDQISKTLQDVPGAKFCFECGFPTTLAEKTDLRGTRGTYRIVSLLGARGMGRLYAGMQLNNGQPVVIKEFLLPNRCFNKEETRQRKDAFVRVAGLSPADGRSQDFRLTSPFEAIADQQSERCYLITQGNIEVSKNLAAYLAEQGAMGASQVRQVLDQVLQSLQFLHTTKFRLPSGQIQPGIAHGNLSLESMLFLGNATGDQFFVYLSDLALWERLFDPPPAQNTQPMPAQDLPALAFAAYYLLVGRVYDEAGRPLDPRDLQRWPPMQRPEVEQPLRELLLRMMGYDALPPFESAEAARRAVLALPEERPDEQSVAPTLDSGDQEKKIPLSTWILLGLGLVLLIAGIVWLLLPRPRVHPQPNVPDRRIAAFTDVSGVPEGTFRYTAERDGSWTYLLRSRPVGNRTLYDLLTEPRTRVKFEYTPRPSEDIATASAPLEAVRRGQANFVITSLLDRLGDDLDRKVIAYDALLVYVANSKQARNLPRALQGRLTLDQLRRLYTGEVTNWKDLGGPDLPVKLYAPPEPEALRMFEKLVFNDDGAKVASFRRLVTILGDKETQNQVLTDYDAGLNGGISFGLLTRLFGQCSGYPLALAEADKTPTQLLVRTDIGHENEEITPDVNLCSKANRPDEQVIYDRSYPLGFPMAVVYPRNNAVAPAGPKFAELMMTREGQNYLSRLGIAKIPLQVFVTEK